MARKHKQTFLFLVLLGCMVIYLTLFKETSTVKSFDASTRYGIAKIDYFLRRQPISLTLKKIELNEPNESNRNQSGQENTCRLPQLELIGHTNVEKYVPCKMIYEWGYLKNGHWYLNKTVLTIVIDSQLPLCKYRNITRPVDDFNLSYSENVDLHDGQRITSEVIEVTCKSGAQIFNNIYVQIVDKSEEIDRRNRLEGFRSESESEKKSSSSSSSSCRRPLNILLLSYDSMSRVSWFRRLPLTTQFVLNKSNDFTLLYGFNILGDGTPACMIPLLTGATESELPSTLKSNPKGHFVDQVYPFIWNDLHRKNYVSFHMEDWPQVSAFTYRLRGMSNRTAHHYMRAYQFGLWKRVSKAYFSGKDDLCVGAQKRHKRALDLIEEFIKTYEGRGRPYVAITHYIENSHDGNARANQIDADLRRFLERALSESDFKDTVIFLYSDHGARFATERLTPQGDIEERTPFFAIRLPTWYKQTHPDKYNNLLKNSHRLTSPFDIYATLRDVSCLGDNNRTRLTRSQSLLRPIPPERSCLDIGISMHYCICQLDWQTGDVTSSMAREALKYALNYINQLLQPASKFCAQLNLLEMTSVKYAHKFVVETGQNETFFKLNFQTRPNRGMYSAVVKFNKKSGYSIESRTSISRTNAYGNQAKCLEKMRSTRAELLVDLRKFCFCNSALRMPFRMHRF